MNKKYDYRKVFIMLISYSTIGMLGIYITLYQYTILSISQLFFLNATMMGLLIGIQHFGMSIPPLILGVLSGKLGKKRVVLIAYFLIIIGTFLVGITSSFYAFVVSVFIIGAGFSVAEATLSALLADEFPEESTRQLNFSQVAFSVGALAGPFIAAGLINSGIYFKDIYIYCSMVFFLLGGVFVFVKQKNDNSQEEVQRVTSHIVKFVRNKVFLLLGFVIFFYVGLENTIANFTDSYYELELGAPQLSAIALSLFWGAMIPSRLLAGIIKMNIKKMFIFLSVVVFAAIIAAMLLPNYIAKLVMFALCGFGCGPLWPLMMDTVAKKSKGSSGPVLNIMFAFCAMGGAILPLVSGIIVNISNQSGAYFVSAFATVIMLVVYLISLKNKNTDLL